MLPVKKELKVWPSPMLSIYLVGRISGSTYQSMKIYYYEKLQEKIKESSFSKDGAGEEGNVGRKWHALI